MTTDYDVIVIGGGAAGLTSAGMAAHLGAKTVLIERSRLGGDCTWTGCVPSKALLKAAKVAHQVRTASTFGFSDQALDVDFGQVMEHVRSVRQGVYHEADRPEIFEEMGIDVRSGAAHFVDAHTVAVDAGDGTTEQITGRFVVVATGARPAVPPIEGLDTVEYLTSETIFELEEKPEHLAIVGAGPIGTEMAQAFIRLGSQVTVLDAADRILPEDDPQLAHHLQKHLEGEGIRYALETRAEEVNAEGDTLTVLTSGIDAVPVKADALLLATGRRPNVEGLNLDAAGVEYDGTGISITDRCRTSQRHIYAAGDVTGRYQFTHMSDHMAKVAVTNALLKVPKTIDTDHVPWVTYTDPELAHVGAQPEALEAEGISHETYRFPYDQLDRALAESETTGLIKVHATSLTGKILGASVLGERAGELITSFALAMRNGTTLRNIADTIHPYPTYGEGVRRVADQWYVQKQSPFLTKIVQTLFGYRGPVLDPGPNEIL